MVEKKDEKIAAPVKEVKPAAADPAQPKLSDFGLHECLTCDKRVMGFDQRKHVNEIRSTPERAWIGRRSDYRGS